MHNTYEQRLKRNIRKFYLCEILSGMFFSVPIFVLFWQKNGLSLMDIMLLQSIFSILTVILEIPTGYFADMYGRKITLFLAGVSFFIAISAYSLGYNFSQFLIAEIFFALATSLHSGTHAAFVYDTLYDLRQEKTYKKIWGNVLFFHMLALAISGIIGSLIATVDLRYTLYASIPFFFFLIPLILSMQEPHRHKLIIEKGYVAELLKIITITIVKNEKLRWLIIFSGIIYAFNQSALWLYQPYFRLTGVDIAYFGIVFAGFHIVAAFSSKYAHQIEEKIGQTYSLVMLVVLVAGSYLLMSNVIFLFSFSFCFLQQFARGFKNAVITDYINKLTTSNMRATVLSAESFVGKLLYAAIIPVIGWIADIYSLVQALSILAITTFVSGIIILILLRKNKVI